MITISDIVTPAPAKATGTKGILSRLVNRVRDLFTPEEVEVTFTKVGNSTKYSYRKVRHKQLA